MTHSWDPVLMPAAYSWGFTGGPSFATSINRHDGGGEVRVQFEEVEVWRWACTRQNYASSGVTVDDLVNFFLSRRGGLYGWLFIDPSRYSTAEDSKSAETLPTDQIIGVGDGTTTRFPIRVTTHARGDASGRVHTRFVVPLHGMREDFFATRVLGLAEGTTFTATVAVDGVVDHFATWSIATGEVILSAAPAPGALVTWGGFFCVPARFSANTDKQLDQTVEAFNADRAAFEVESITQDIETPMLPGGTPFGCERWDPMPPSIARTPANGFLQVCKPTSTSIFFLFDPYATPLGGPYFCIENIGTANLEVRDQFSALVGTAIAPGAAWFLFLGIDGSGNRAWRLVPA